MTDATFDEDFDRLMDATQTLIQLKPGDVLTQEMIDDLHLVDKDHRESFERATDAFHKGYEAGVERGCGADIAKLIEERDSARDEAAIARALRDVFRDADAVKALVTHNDALRSAYQVAARAGARTDWFSLADQLNAVLTKYHSITNKARDLAASVGRNPEGEDREDGLRAEHEHAVTPKAADAKTLSDSSQ